MAKMAEAVQAALVGPEQKKLKIYDHEFNVKQTEPAKDGDRLVVNGQISHHLSFRPDDQVYYIITVEKAAITDIQRKIARGGMRAGLAAPVVSAFGAYFGVPIPPDKAEEIGRTLGKMVDGTWEKAVEVIIASIAMAFQQQELTSDGSGTDGMVQEAIREKWLQLGEGQSFLGRPLTGETATPDGVGRYNHFEGGSIYWTPETGAHEVHGLIREKWSELGWERSFLGYPLTDETTTPDGVGRYNHFEGGSIYWTPETGAHEVHGLIREKWSELGWEQGVLGYPISDETPTPDNLGRRNDFQRGSVEWTPNGGAREILA